MSEFIRWFEELSLKDVPLVGGKNASLGRLIGTIGDFDIAVPRGFAVTADAYRTFLDENGLRAAIGEEIEQMRRNAISVPHAGRVIRRMMLGASMPQAVAAEIRSAYAELSRWCMGDSAAVAVRSSATAEDLPEASFAGMHESFLNVSGADDVVDAVQRCFASAFTDRAIVYREEKHFDHLAIALSAGVQKMVQAERGVSGVIFTIDPDSGFPNVVVINASWGFGELVVKGMVNPDQFTVFKPLLSDRVLRPIIEKTLGAKARKLVLRHGIGHSLHEVSTSGAERQAFVLADDEILRLARCAAQIELQYGAPMDIEFAKDGITGELFVLQARPETVQSRKRHDVLSSYRLRRRGKRLVSGTAVGEAIVSGRVARVLEPADIDSVPDGAILVATATEPDWTPVLERVAGIVTDSGGRTCHAAIVARELGIPAIVGTEVATEILTTGLEVTLSCAEGETGCVYEERLPFDRIDVPLASIPKTQARVLLNVSTPSSALQWWNLPADGIGLARIEFLISDVIRIHPMALVRPELVVNSEEREEIERLTAGYARPVDYFVDRLSRGIAQIAASQYPRPVIVRTSDLKSNEYRNLIGGDAFEHVESNPMLGLRGASRYTSEAYAPAFALECEAILKARETMGFSNIAVLIPFCRTVEEADRVLMELARNGLGRGRNGLEVLMMCEIPSNVILMHEFAKRFNGFSIGSNDLTQLILGVDRDSAALAPVFDEHNEAVKTMIRQAITAAHLAGRKIGLCGQAPSDDPEFARFLAEAGIDSISLSPDSFVRAKQEIADAELETAVKADQAVAVLV